MKSVKSKLTCIVVIELVRPGSCHVDTLLRWREQRDKERDLSPPPRDGTIRCWKGQPEERDWDSLVAGKVKDGWGNLSHRREFVSVTAEVVDRAVLS